MPQDATCPQCTHLFPVTEARNAFTVACPKCDAELTAEFKKPVAPPEAGQPPYDLVVKPGALAGNPVPPPVPRKKKDDDDEPQDDGGGSALIVIFSAGFGLLVVLAGLGLTGWLLFTQIDVSDTVSNRSTGSSGPSGKTTNPKGIGGTPGTKGTTPGKTAPDPFIPPPAPKPKDTFELRPVAGTVPPIVAPTFDANATQTLLLPGKVGAVAVGGGGRYIAFHIPQPGRLVVFDANIGDLLPDGGGTDAGEVQMAAGANKLVTIQNGGKKGRVYSLPELQQQNEFELPTFFGVKSIALGSRTNGPLFVTAGFRNLMLMDLATGKPVEGSETEMDLPSNHARATADGKLFLVGDGFGPNNGFKTVDEAGKKWQVKTPGIAAAYPGADGKRLYGRDQIVAPNGASIAGKPKALTNIPVWYVPAVTATGNYFLRVNEVKFGNPPNKTGVSIALHRDRTVDSMVLPPWEGLPEAEGLLGPFGDTEPLDRRLFLIPEAKLLVILDREKTRLIVRKLPI